MPKSNKDFSVSVIIVGTEGVPLVKESYRKNNKHRLRWWKLPGGHGDEGETPKEAIIRETLEETNIEIYENEIEFLLVENRGSPVSHKFYLFFVDISNVRLSDRCTRFLLGDSTTGEETKVVKLPHILKEIELPSHQRLLKLPRVQKVLKGLKT